MDGIDHINIFSRGQTELGRLLSNFAHTPLNLPEGHFESLEGYWYWLGCRDDKLRTLYGFEAKRYGRTIPQAVVMAPADFMAKIKLAMRWKIEQHQQLRELLKASTLPLRHYYVFDGKVQEAGCLWIVATWEVIRRELQA